MVRKLVRTLLSLSLVSPLTAWGLGLGEVHLHSALNEKLNATIDLLSVQPNEVDGINAALASYDDFTRFGVDRPSSLALLQFTVEQDKNGKPYIKVTSRQPIREPFLDFLLDLNWRNGRLLREYTLLLDPPDLARAGGAPAVSAPVAASTARPAPKTAPAALSPAPTAPQPLKPAAVQAEPTGRSLVYGPVKSNDTLWSIAKQLRPNDSVTVKQMMMALYRANPNAFLDENINNLRRGSVLRLEDLKAINTLSRAEAEREVAQQDSRWAELRQKLASQGQSRPQSGDNQPASSASTAAAPQARLKLVAPEGKDDKALAGGTATKAGIEQVRKELQLAQEAAAAQKKENEELRTRMESLQGQVASMQRLLSLKSQDLAQLQRQLGKEPTAQVPAASTPAAAAGEAAPMGKPDAGKPETGGTGAGQADVAGSAKPATTPTEPAKPLVAPAGTIPSDTAKPTGAGEPASAPGSTVPPQPAPGQPGPGQQPVPKPAAKPIPKPIPKPHIKPVKPAEPDASLLDGVVDSVLSNPFLSIGGGIGAIGALLLAWMFMKKKKPGGGFQESILSGGTSSMLAAKEGDNTSSSLETSLISDLSDDGVGGMPAQESEVDPTTEADVYMAYGRHQQAEELLKDAIEHEPERHELLVKLMEVYYKTGNSEAFADQAEAAHQAIGSGALWDKIAVMGHELLPGNPLFAAAPEKAQLGFDEDEPAIAVDDVLDIGLDLDALAAEMEPSEEFGGAAGDDYDLGLDLGLDLGSDSNTNAATPNVEEMPLDLASSDSAEEPAGDDLADLDFGESAAEAETAAAEGHDDGGFGDLDFALDLNEQQGASDLGSEAESTGTDNLDFLMDDTSAEIATAAPEPAGDGGSLDFDLSDFASDDGAGSAATELEEGSGMEFDLGDFNLDAEETKSETNDSSRAMDGFDMGEEAGGEGATDYAGLEITGESDDLDLSGLDFGDGMDELGTKLDLATAYVEMGDSDGAREMLQEVISNGDATQQQKARQLMDQIAASA